MSRRPGRKRSATGSAPTRTLLQPSAACRGSSFPTTPRSPSSRPVCTSRRSTERMPRWRRITAPPLLPTRPRRPRDKAKVEAGVLIVERWLIGRLRDRRFYSLAELNAAIGELLKRLNEQRPIRRLGVTRRQLLEELDRPALKPLPTEPHLVESGTRPVGHCPMMPRIG